MLSSQSHWEDVLQWEKEERPECIDLEHALEGEEYRDENIFAAKAAELLRRCGVVVFPRGFFPAEWIEAAQEAATTMVESGADGELWPADTNQGGRMDICPPWRSPFAEEMIRLAWDGPFGALLRHTGYSLDFWSLLAAFHVPEGGQTWHVDTDSLGVLKVQCALTHVERRDGMIQVQPWGVAGRPLSLDSLRPGDCLAYLGCVRHRGGGVDSQSNGKIVMDINFRLPFLGWDNVSDGTLALWSDAAQDANQRRRNMWESLRVASAA